MQYYTKGILPPRGCDKPWLIQLSVVYADACLCVDRLVMAYCRHEAMPSLVSGLHSTSRADLCHSCTEDFEADGRPPDRLETCREL